MKHVLVTGGTGFIGQRLIAALLTEQVSLRLLSRSEHPDFETVVCDLQSERIPDDAFSGIDTVLHLAARVHIMKDSASDPLNEFRRVNRDATLRLAKLAATTGVRRFIYMSSIGVLGDTSSITGSFDNKTCYNPQNPYTVSKMEAEIGLTKISDSTAMEVVIVRSPLVYGARVPGNFYRLLRLVDIGVPLPFGRMLAKKSMISVENLCMLLVRCVSASLPQCSQFVVSDGSEWSTADLLKLIAQIMGKKQLLLPVPVRLLEVIFSLIGKATDIRKLAAPLIVAGSETAGILQWEPVQTPETGVKEAVDYYLSGG